MVDKLNRKAKKMAQGGDPGPESGDRRSNRMQMSDESLERMGTEGKYYVYILCYAIDAPKGYIIVPVIIPNKKEFRRVKRQMYLVRKGLKSVVWYKNNYKQWQSINCRGQVVLSVTPHAVEGRMLQTPEGKKKIIIAGEDTPSFN